MSNTTVKAKFVVEGVSKFVYGEVVAMKAVHATPPNPADIAKKKKIKPTENTTYSKSIPSADVKFQINSDSPEFGKLNPGDEVYVTFEVAPKDKK